MLSRLLTTLLLAGSLPALQQLVPGLIARLQDSAVSLRIPAPSPNFRLEPGESIHPLIHSAFQAEFSGLLLITQAGTYEFNSGSATIELPSPTLSVGHHPITIRFRRTPGTASLRLLWRSEHFDWEPVPDSAFFHSSAQSPSEQELRIEEGRRLVRHYGCVNCHAAGSWKTPAPTLSAIGSRTNPAWLHAWLADPQAFRSGARMPEMLSDGQRADVTAFLATLTDAAAPPPRRRPSEVDIGKGSELTGTIGCLACHQEPGLKLQWLGSKYNLPALASYLRDPSEIEPSGAMPSLLLNDADANAIAAHLLTSRNPAFERTPPSGDPLRGKQLVQSQGCLACHALDSTPNQFQARPLSELSKDGCLATEPPSHLPRYRLQPGQRLALQAFLDHSRANPRLHDAPIDELRQSLTSLRCNSCHETNTGLVPSLVNAGDKLTTSWISQVLFYGKRLRQNQEIRMPYYPAGLLNPIPFAKAEGLAAEEAAQPTVTASHRDIGIGLLGTNPRKQGMGCIGCHDWGVNKSLGEEGPQLINAGQRLRWDWFERWMLDPPRILSGTSMPAYFRGMDRARARGRILAFWAAMRLGPDTPTPDGYRLVSADAEAKPIPKEEAIVIRWDMPEATPAAIAVGLPGGKLSYCFDAGESRLRYAWLGGFLDMSGTLLRKTDTNKLTPTADLIGEIFYRESAFPLRIGSPANFPRPRFRGYRILGGVPEFHYRIDSIDVFEKLEPAGENAIRRTLRIAPAQAQIWFAPEGAEPKLVPQGKETVLEQVLRP